MTLWNPEYRVKINGFTVTSITLAGLSISTGRSDIYSQPQAGSCQIALLETEGSPVPYEINDSFTIEVKDSSGNYVYLFGGFVSDIAIQVNMSGDAALTQTITITAIGALARLARATYSGNLASDTDGDQIYEVLNSVLFDTWNEVPASETWAEYDPTVTWANAENTGLGEIDRPGDYELDSQNGVLSSVYSLVANLATSGLGYVYEDSQGKIGYADASHRTEYLVLNGYTLLDGNAAIGPGLNVAKRSGDVRNDITISYTSSGNSSVNAKDTESVASFGQFASSIRTTLKNQTDAEAQAAFYLSLRAFPEYGIKSITFELQSPELGDTDRDALLNVFMGLPVHIINLPANMTGGEFEGFVEGWSWSAGYNRLRLTLNLTPSEYSLQATRWQNVNAAESWNTISASLEWLDATIVA